ncbi:MAG: hypothetical protein PWR01_662 [Clostridiales bacterium]|jgi:hypothetical protein|nr:hypothetical protein [Clostridiales bacterium]
MGCSFMVKSVECKGIIYVMGIVLTCVLEN